LGDYIKKQLEDLKISHDIPAESGVVGSVLKTPELISHVEFMNPNMFNDNSLSALYWCINELVESGIDEIDDLTIVQKITSSDLMHLFESVSDLREYINKLKMLGTKNIGEFIRRCRVVATIDYRENVLKELSTTMNYVKDTGDDINEVSYHVNDKISSVGDNYLIHNETPLIGDFVDEFWNEIQEQSNEDGIVGLPSKFPMVNNYFTYEPAELIIVGGEKKAGKSVIILNEAYHKAKNGVPTLILDTELSSQQFFTRLLALISQLEVRKIKSGNLSDEDLEKIYSAKKIIKGLPLAHVYLPEKAPNWKFTDLYSIAKSYKHKIDLGFLIFDYIKADTVSDLNINESSYLGDLTNYLKNKISGRLGIPCLAGAQMSPYEMRLSDSDKLNRYASTVFYWIKKSPDEIIGDGKESGTHKIFVDYNRLGRQFDDPETEYINMYADFDKMSIYQCDKQPLANESKPWE
jgi:replicative DNA helicase